MTNANITRAGTHKVAKFGPNELPRWYKTSLQYRYPIDKPDPNNFLKKGEGERLTHPCGCTFSTNQAQRCEHVFSFDSQFLKQQTLLRHGSFGCR